MVNRRINSFKGTAFNFLLIFGTILQLLAGVRAYEDEGGKWFQSNMYKTPKVNKDDSGGLNSWLSGADYAAEEPAAPPPPAEVETYNYPQQQQQQTQYVAHVQSNSHNNQQNVHTGQGSQGYPNSHNNQQYQYQQPEVNYQQLHAQQQPQQHHVQQNAHQNVQGSQGQFGQAHHQQLGAIHQPQTQTIQQQTLSSHQFQQQAVHQQSNTQQVQGHHGQQQQHKQQGHAQQPVQQQQQHQTPNQNQHGQGLQGISHEQNPQPRQLPPQQEVVQEETWKTKGDTNPWFYEQPKEAPVWSAEDEKYRQEVFSKMKTKWDFEDEDAEKQRKLQNTQGQVVYEKAYLTRDELQNGGNRVQSGAVINTAPNGQHTFHSEQQLGNYQQQQQGDPLFHPLPKDFYKGKIREDPNIKKLLAPTYERRPPIPHPPPAPPSSYGRSLDLDEKEPQIRDKPNHRMDDPPEEIIFKNRWFDDDDDDDANDNGGSSHHTFFQSGKTCWLYSIFVLYINFIA